MASFFIVLDTVGVEKITNPIFRSLFIIRVLRDRSRSLRRNNLYEKNKKFGYPCWNSPTRYYTFRNHHDFYTTKWHHFETSVKNDLRKVFKSKIQS